MSVYDGANGGAAVAAGREGEEGAGSRGELTGVKHKLFRDAADVDARAAEPGSDPATRNHRSTSVRDGPTGREVLGGGGGVWGVRCVGCEVCLRRRQALSEAFPPGTTPPPRSSTEHRAAPPSAAVAMRPHVRGQFEQYRAQVAPWWEV